MSDERKWTFLVPITVAAAALLASSASFGALVGGHKDDLLLDATNPAKGADQPVLLAHGSHSSHSSHSSHGSSR